MGKFEVGQEVVVLEEIVNMYGDVGNRGKILSESWSLPGLYRVKVYFNGTQSDDFTIDGDELRPLEDYEPQPAGADGLSAFAQAAQGDDTLAVALYEKAALEGVIADLQAELAQARALLETATNGLETIARDGMSGNVSDYSWEYLANERKVIAELVLANVRKQAAPGAAK